jgi:hypothetical protein
MVRRAQGQNRLLRRELCFLEETFALGCPEFLCLLRQQTRICPPIDDLESFQEISDQRPEAIHVDEKGIMALQ